jgi:DNA polymerase III gamma/tau subunit
VTEMTNKEQMGVWKKELTVAMVGQQWRRVLQICSWLRYALRQQRLSDPEIEQMRRQAKEALAEQVIGERIQQERECRHQQLQHQIVYQIASGDWEQAMDSIEAIYQDGANRQEVINLLQELEVRLAIIVLSPQYRQMDQRAAALSRRFDELVERVGGIHH